MENLVNPFIFLGIALILIFLEFFLPGGVFGMAGALFWVGSFVLLMMSATNPLFLFLYLLISVGLLFFLIRFALWRIKKTGKENTILLEEDQAGYTASQFDKTLVGKTGQALTVMNPSGKIIIEGQEYQATSIARFIEKGSPVMVVDGEGSHLTVKKKH